MPVAPDQEVGLAVPVKATENWGCWGTLMGVMVDRQRLKIIIIIIMSS